MTTASRSRRARTQARTRVRGKKKTAIEGLYSAMVGAAGMGLAFKMLEPFERELLKPKGRISFTLEWGEADRDG